MFGNKFLGSIQFRSIMTGILNVGPIHELLHFSRVFNLVHNQLMLHCKSSARIQEMCPSVLLGRYFEGCTWVPDR